MAHNTRHEWADAILDQPQGCLEPALSVSIVLSTLFFGLVVAALIVRHTSLSDQQGEWLLLTVGLLSVYFLVVLALFIERCVWQIAPMGSAHRLLGKLAATPSDGRRLGAQTTILDEKLGGSEHDRV